MTSAPGARSWVADPATSSSVDAELLEHKGGRTLRMRRVLAHEPERVWPMLTDPQQLARRSPLVPDRPLTLAGPATSRETPDADPVDAQVLRCEPPSCLCTAGGRHSRAPPA